MKQDIVANALNQIMNAKRVEKKELVINRSSKLLIGLFEMMKERKYIDFEQEGNSVKVKIIDLTECKSVKPRFFVKVDEIDKYLRRYLPSRNFGTLVISTSKGLMTQQEAIENKIGGALIAYFF